MGMYKKWWEWMRNGVGMDPEWMRTKQDQTRTPGNSRNGQGIIQKFRNEQGMDKESSRNGGGV